jgi:hypothetical protein
MTRFTPLTRLAPLRVLVLAVGLGAVVLLFVVAIVVLATTAHAQGCSQCLDSTRATPPSVQTAYRHAIYLLAGAAASIFVGATLLLRRER